MYGIPLSLRLGGAAALLLCAAAGAAGAESASRHHAIDIHGRILTPDEGLLLGNGDLSVSVYQTADGIVWRFGKGDVWDRRLDLSDNPKPAHIEEIARGIMVEGWKCGPYGGPVKALHGSRNPKRMREICQGTPPGYKHRPYPCPKPLGELILHLPPDLPGMRISQHLDIEAGTLDIDCAWASEVALHVACFIPPAPNVLVVRWRLKNWTERTRMGNRAPPVWFALQRAADPPIAEFAARFFAAYRHGGFRAYRDPKVTPLPPPAVVRREGGPAIRQDFPASPLFPRGFSYLLLPLAPDMTVQAVDMGGPAGGACLHLLPGLDRREGVLAVATPTASDPGGVEAEAGRIVEDARPGLAAAVARWNEARRADAEAFWGRSSVKISDRFLEDLWYQTLYAKRCIYRAGKVPPGLFFPSTVRAYSHWHGDYHTNYNYQSVFWGDYTANHLELGDAWFDGMKYFLQIGRKIARDYYGCRGVFIQLSGFPIHAEDDPLGVAPMGRMAYMTGWMATQYWRRYLVTKDKAWLRRVGYPVLRDVALFYTDFLKKGEDGLYHAFPSNQGEDGFSGNPKDYTDRRQVIEFARWSLRMALAAAAELGADPELRAAWRDRLAHCAPPDGRPEPERKGLEKWCVEHNPPQFGVGRPYVRRRGPAPGPSPYANPKSARWTWYFGQFPWEWRTHIRENVFDPDRDIPAVRRLLRRWRRPNGLLWAMAVANYGRCGAWTESLGVLGPLEDMMLQSWDGALRIFPAWPRDVDAEFARFRAEGAFLVSAAWRAGRVAPGVEIVSERGGVCRVWSPWDRGIEVRDEAGRAVPVTPGPFGRPGFETRPGRTYRLFPLPRPK